MLEGHSFLWWSSLSGLGLGVGIIAGMFGVGGGFLMTPLLALLFRIPVPVAIGTGLCQMIGVAVSAFLRHRKLGQGEVKIDWIMMAGSLLGVGLGVRAVTALSAQGMVTVAGHPITAAKLWLSLGYIVLLGGVAAWMWRDSQRPSLPPGALPAPGPLARFPLPPFTLLPRSGHRVSVPLLAYLGLLMGFLSGLLGIGGGVALTPILLYGVGMRVRTVAGTGILMLLATALAGTYAHAREGNVRLGMAMVLLVGSSVGAQIGATWTSRLDGRRLRRIFVYVVVLTAAAVVWDLSRALLASHITTRSQKASASGTNQSGLLY